MSISVNTLVTTSTVDSDSNWMTNAYSAFALPLKLRSLPSSNVFGNYGSRGGFRTPNPAVNSRMLYRWATLELKWHGRWVTLPHFTVLETVAFLVCHVHIMRVWWIASITVIYRHSRKLEPAARIELATDGLQNHCSTAELRWHKNCFTKGIFSPLVGSQIIPNPTGVSDFPRPASTGFDLVQNSKHSWRTTVLPSLIMKTLYHHHPFTSTKNRHFFEVTVDIVQKG